MILLGRLLFKNKKLFKFIQKNKCFFIVCLLAFVFFLGTSSFYFLAQSDGFIKWTSPDETANYIFTKLYAQSSKLTITEKYNLYTESIMHPRSFRADGEILKPVSFLGIILIFGGVAKIIGCNTIPFLTPFFGALGIIFFYLLIKKIFGARNALISAFLMATFPPFVYYAARSMFHNVLFVSLLIISLYFMVAASGKINKKNLKIKSFLKIIWPYWLCSCLAGLFFGLTINIRRIDIVRILFFILFLFFAILPAIRFNQDLYGSYFFGGYSEMNKSIVNISNAGSDIIKSSSRGDFVYYKDLFNIIKDNIFYFGFSPRQSLEMLNRYFVRMFPYLFWGACVGFILFFTKKKKWKMRYITYVIFTACISAILVLYYGSWIFHDNPDPNSYTIGNSYARYWLPVYFSAIPFTSFLIMRFSMSLVRVVAAAIKRFSGVQTRGPKKTFYIYALRIVIVGVVCLMYLQFVLIKSEDGLLYLGMRHKDVRGSIEKVLSLTEHNSAIITFYHDKMFFPERKVIVGLFNDKNMIAQYANLAEFLPVYYYNFTLPQKDIDYLNARRLGEAGLGIEKVQKITEDFTLYKIIKLK